MLGRAAGRRNTQADKSSGVMSKYHNPTRGYHFLHTAIDGYSRLAYSELLPDERKETAAGFWNRANTLVHRVRYHRTESVDRQRLLLQVAHIP